jgi:hypothetical protein
MMTASSFLFFPSTLHGVHHLGSSGDLHLEEDWIHNQIAAYSILSNTTTMRAFLF